MDFFSEASLEQRDGQETLEAIKGALRSELRAAPDGLYGAQVGTIIKRAAPTFSLAQHGVEKLRDFVAKYLPDVLEEAGRSGKDIIYRGAAPAPVDEPSFSGGFWRAWVSPRSPMANFIDRRNGALRVKPVNVVPLNDEFRLTPLEAFEHKEIARAFVDHVQHSLGAEGLSTLLAIPFLDDDAWWPQWQRALRGPCSHIAATWNRFRQAALEQKLQARLAEHGLGHVSAAVIAEMKRDRGGERRAKAGQGNHQPPVASSAAEPTPHELAHRVIDGLSSEDLRRLWLPLGLVLDMLKPR